MNAETRRAHGRFALEGETPSEGEIAVDDDGVSAGPVRVEFLDADTFTDANRVLTLELFPKGKLSLSMLGRRHDTFSAALAEARDAARVAGTLAHGIAAPEVFAGAVGAGDAARPARILLYATHVTAVPEGADPFQVPLGAVRDVTFDESRHAVALETDDGATILSRLARRTDEAARKVRAAREAQAQRLAELSGTNLFVDGAGVSARALGARFDRLLESWSAPERVDGAREIVSLAKGEARIGLVELLDPDEEGLAAKDALPENTAAFLLVPVGSRVLLEILSGPSAATYAFEGTADAIGRDLQALHFRRRPLALTEEEAAGGAGRPYRLALRRLESLRRLRAATRARVFHGAGWSAALKKALA